MSDSSNSSDSLDSSDVIGESDMSVTVVDAVDITVQSTSLIMPSVNTPSKDTKQYLIAFQHLRQTTWKA